MSKHMTIINLACTITKLRKWGEAWKHSAESAQAATARMNQAHEAKMVEHRAAFGARTEADAKIIAGLRSENVAARMAALERDSLISDRDGLLTQVQDMRAEIKQRAKEQDQDHKTIVSLISERDGLRVQVQDMREEIIRVNEAHGRTKVEHDGLLDELAVQRDAFTANVERIRRELCEGRDALRAEVAALQERLRASIARGDFAQMEVAALRPKYKVGDKLESYGSAVTIVGVRTVYDCQAEGAEYPVGHSEDELTERYEQTPPEATHAEPDLTQLHAKGKEAWSDVPNATQWVEEVRGNSEATHDTEEGKAVAESAVRTEPVAEEIKVGDVVKVVGASGCLTAQSDIGKIGEVLKIDFGDGTVLLPGWAGWVNRCDVRKVTT